MERRQACIFEIHPEVLRQMLGLPDGVLVTAVSQPADTLGVLHIRVEGMGWALIEGSRIPLSRPVIRTRTPVSDETVLQVDWNCPMPGHAPE